MPSGVAQVLSRVAQLAHHHRIVQNELVVAEHEQAPPFPSHDGRAPIDGRFTSPPLRVQTSAGSRG